MTNDINVKLIDLKSSAIDELVRRNEDDSYTILLNSRQASNRLKRAYRHAMWHIENNDFDDHVSSINDIEATAHEMDKI